MGKYFGTDGFRGQAGVELTAEHAFKIGRFLGWYYGGMHNDPSSVKNQRFLPPSPQGEGLDCHGLPSKPHNDSMGEGKRGRIVIGKDTRRSSYMLEYALAAGITASGADAYLLHVTTTPSVAFVTRNEEFDCGVMISASHNPFYDNGIKLLNGSGEKMEEAVLEKIEAYLDGEEIATGASALAMTGKGNGEEIATPPEAARNDSMEGAEVPYATGGEIGRTVDYFAGRNRYIGYLISLGMHSFKNKKIGLDCANGAAWMIARSVFEALGAKTYVIGAEPNGTNINAGCGSTHIEALQKLVVEQGLDAGFAYDGDADRCLCVDEKGQLVSGDHILYVLGKYMQERGQLETGTVVTTVMSNLGLYKALDARGIRYEKTQVGDKYVYENMVRNGHRLGGEQSGHIIISQYATTGDGILTSLKMMEVLMEKKCTLSELCKGLTIYPQALKNVRVADKEQALASPGVKGAVEEVARELGENGRILVRPSGTEPVIRVMVEAESESLCEEMVQRVVKQLRIEN